ncbi:nuclear transport factor 2 family protein [uncultured Arthrobacter sp.]|uniref:nuclear transport factor 2 family protein n=1 Tax=uncultured Arthrobacter sp. TaxID=114050 RepID=UPI0028D36587|nr:nuclear transport factor 2 family protein [uncultured Arthrobacter sp.]
MSELDDFLTAMLDRQIAAETAIHNGDVEPRMALFERADLRVDGGPLQSTTLRVTHVYRRESGEWKIVHRHGDYVPLDATTVAEGTAAGRET